MSDDWREAERGAEVERFLKKGIRERSLDGCCVGEGGDEVADEMELLSLTSLDEELADVSEAACVMRGVSDFGMSPKYCSASRRASSCWTPAKATTILSGLKNVSLYDSMTLLLICESLSLGHNNGFPSVLSLNAAMCTNSGKISSGLDQISPISYAAVSSCCDTSSSVIRGSRIVSARRATVVGTAELKVADWYMSDSLEEAQCMFPPNVSNDSSISSLVRFFVDLKASLSIMWLTPLRYSFSYRDPASMNTPTPEKCPGRASVATRTPFGRVEISSSSAGS